MTDSDPEGPPSDGRRPRIRRPSFTERVRQELARELPTDDDHRRSLLAALVALSGSLHLRGEGELRIEITTRSGAVARAGFLLAQRELEVAGHGSLRPGLEVHAPGGVRETSRYVVTVTDGARILGRRLGRIDEDGRPTAGIGDELVEDPGRRSALLRGAVLAGASFSRPGRPHHLEIVTPGRQIADVIATAVEEVAAHRPGVSVADEGWRVVLKSGRAIDRMLASLGAEAAVAERREQRERATLRRRATRLANADAANLRRAVAAAREQVRAVERAVDRVGWDGLDPALREVALARLANPEATLAEIGAFCDPPVGKSAAHRRLARIEELADVEQIERPDAPRR